MTKTYEVTISLKYSPCGQTNGVEYVKARNAREAQQSVRDMLRRQCVFTRHDGPIILKARQVEA